MSETPPPGWYPDPDDPSRVRWWNGSAWADPPAQQQGHLPSSGASRDTGSATASAGATAGAESPASSSNNRGCLVVVAIVVALVVVFSLVGGNGEDTGSETGAFVMCQDFVRDQLRSPSSAGFPTTREATIMSTGSDSYEVRSHVDAENAFGAEVRTEWVCEIEYEGDDRWRGRATLLE